MSHSKGNGIAVMQTLKVVCITAIKLASIILAFLFKISGALFSAIGNLLDKAGGGHGSNH